MRTRDVVIAITAALSLCTATVHAVVFTNSTSIAAGILAYEGQDIVVSNCTLTVDGAHAFASFVLVDHAVLTHTGAPAGEFDNRLDLTIEGDLTVDSGSLISAMGTGYRGNAGPGTTQWDGAGHGGVGGAMGGGGFGAGSGVGGPAYGSMTQPQDFGSGGGNGGGNGGGIIRLTVAGRLHVDGAISADGNAGSQAACTAGSGGSGGSVYLSVGELTGSGRISADGGQGWRSDWCSGITSGGGGGGRVAIYFRTNNSGFAGTVRAVGGSGYLCGGAGTIYTKAVNAAVGDLLVDNAGTNGAMTLLVSPTAFNVTVANGAVVYSTAPVLVNNLVVAPGGTITHLPTVLGVQISCPGSLTVASNGLITAQGKGYGANGGPGTAPFDGAGYGGAGGTMGGGGLGDGNAVGGPTYGSATQPLDFGSGGGNSGGSGGGIIRLIVGRELIVDGIITANGNAGDQSDCTAGSGGSGGSVYLSVGELTGGGRISAGGGQGWYSGWCSGITSGGGGGGRIAIYGTISSTQSPLLDLSGGAGWRSGETGSLFTSTNTPPMVIDQSPMGHINRLVSSVEVTFNQSVDASSFTPDDIVVLTPNGPISTAQITLTGGTDGSTWRIGFPLQTVNGLYSVTVGPRVAGFFGQEMPMAYQGTFHIEVTPPTLSISRLGSQIHLEWPSVVGLRTQLQSTTSLSAVEWTDEGVPFSGTGEVLSTNLPLDSLSMRFLRLRLSD